MHFGIYDYGDARRIMHRIILRGERPVGVAGSAGAPGPGTSRRACSRPARQRPSIAARLSE